jgi:hypothetical protein
VRYVVSIAFLAIGLATVGVGGRMALTGKNVTGLLGRGLTKADDLRLQRAPTSYFRAMGSMLLSLGLLVAWVGVFFLTVGEEPDDAYFAAMLSLAALIVVALLASAAWITVLARRHKLFRWNKS